MHKSIFGAKMCYSGCSWTKSHTQTQNSKKLCLQGKAELAWECVFLAHCLICTCKIHQDGFYKQVTPTSCADETFILPLSRVLILILDKKFWYNFVFVQRWKRERDMILQGYKLCGNRKGRSHLLLIFVLFPFPLTRISDWSFSVVAFFKAEIKKGKKLFRNQKQSEHLVGKLIKLCF